MCVDAGWGPFDMMNSVGADEDAPAPDPRSCVSVGAEAVVTERREEADVTEGREDGRRMCRGPAACTGTRIACPLAAVRTATTAGAAGLTGGSDRTIWT
jgi:hypothetical protein